MAKKKTKKKTTGRKGERKFRFLYPMAIAGLVVITIAATFYMFFLHPSRTGIPEFSETYKTSPPAQSKTVNQIVMEPGNQKKIKPDAIKLPRVAIIIDDIGYRKATADALIDMDLELNFAFLPHGPNTTMQLEKAHAKGREILLHFPMEANGYDKKTGPGTVYSSMGAKEMKKVFKKNLAAVPMAIGTNNHMGSRFTKNKAAMARFLGNVKREGLFFVDSVTDSDSLGYSMAKSMGIPAAKRDVFLDNVEDVNAIVKQLESLVGIAERRGTAIGIGHPKPETLEAITMFQNQLRKRVRLVRVSELVD